MQAQPGHFYAVGIGPGSPDLLTIRAMRIIESADIILTPQAKGTNRSNVSTRLYCVFASFLFNGLSWFLTLILVTF